MVHTRIQHSVRNDKIEQEKKTLLGYYDYTVILTYSGMLSAFIGILSSINEHFKAAVICLMLSGLCDMFDGAVASTKVRTKSQKRFGIQIDSLSDLISFGVLPAVFLYMSSGKSALSGVISSVYVLCSLIRLSYFNVLEEDRQDNTDEKRSDYLGVPVTTVALLLPMIYLSYFCGIIKNQIWFSVMLIILGVFFILSVNVKKPNTYGKIAIILLGTAEIISLLIIN